MSKRYEETWPAEAVMALRVLVESKSPPSSSEMAKILGAQFGMTLTRNSILGKKHRLGLSVSRDVPEATVTEVADEAPAPAPVTKAKAPAPAAPPAVLAVPRARATFPLPPAAGYTTLEIPMGACRYPISGGDGGVPLRMCGHKAREGKSWCEAHFAIVFPAERQMRETLARRAAAQVAA